MSVRKTGFKFAALSERVRKNISEELNTGASSFVTLAQELSPVDTGYMRDHISQTEESSPSKLKSVVESEADYSAFVEYGTINMEAQPFFHPAFESARRFVNNALLRALR